jgi:hypothetical protein
MGRRLLGLVVRPAIGLLAWATRKDVVESFVALFAMAVAATLLVLVCWGFGTGLEDLSRAWDALNKDPAGAWRAWTQRPVQRGDLLLVLGIAWAFIVVSRIGAHAPEKPQSPPAPAHWNTNQETARDGGRIQEGRLP